MKTFITLIFCVTVCCLNAQCSKRFNLEGGSLINTALSPSQFSKDNGNSTFSYELNAKFNTSYGYFFKLSYDLTIKARQNWVIYAPMGFAYNNHVIEMHREGYINGCFGAGPVNENIRTETSIIGCFAGLAFEYRAARWQPSLALLLHNTITCKTNIQTTRPDLPPANYSDKYLLRNHYLSSQLTLLYKLEDYLAIGPACEVYFYNLGALAGDFKETGENTQNQKIKINMKQGGDNLWICPGLKMRITL